MKPAQAILLCLIATLSPTLGAQAQSKPADDKPKSANLIYVKLTTNFGDIVLELIPEKAPVTVENFLRYVDDGFYNGTIFHRVMSNFMIQGGGYDKDRKPRKTHPPIKNESKNGLKNERGTVAMARMAAPDSAASQFFINVKSNPNLDEHGAPGYAVFGKVISGMDVVDKIRYIPTENKGDAFTNLPTQLALIERCVRLNESEIKSVLAKAEQDKKEAKKKALDDARALIKSKGVDLAKCKPASDGLWFADAASGEGSSPSASSTVSIHFTAWLTNGTKVDSTSDRGSGEPATFQLNKANVKGWIEGIRGMKKGGKRYLIVPPNLAYGDRDLGFIPPNSTLIYEIQLLDIK